LSRIFNISFILFLLVFSSCKNKEKAVVNKHNPMSDALIFKNKFHEANSEKMIGHYDKAIALFNECIVLKPNSAASYFGLSELYLKQKNQDKGLTFAQKSYDLNKTNKWYLIHLADLYHAVGNYHQSSNLYEVLFADFNETNIEYRYKLVEALIYSNQNAKAIQQLNKIELETGKTPELSLTKHDLFNALGKKDLANQEIESLLKEYPTDESIRLQLLDYYLQTNQVEKATNVAQDILKINPNSGDAFLGLADIEIRSNHIDKSFDYLEKGFQDQTVDIKRKMSLLNGLTTYALDKKDPNSILINTRLAALYQNMELNESDNANFLMLYGTYLNMNDKTIEAREKFAKSCQLNPSDYRAWDGLLNVDYSANLFDSLFIDGQKAIELYPTQPMVYLLTGIGGYESKHYEAAEELLILGQDFVVNDKELSSEFEYHLGKTYWKSGQKDEGEKYFSKALVTNPNSAKIYYGYSVLLFEDKKYDLALIQSQKAVEIEPKNALYLDHYALVLMKQKQYVEAEKTLEKAVVIDYTNALILEHYGDALFFNGKIDNAVEMWKESQKQGNTSTVLLKKIRDKKYYDA